MKKLLSMVLALCLLCCLCCCKPDEPEQPKKEDCTITEISDLSKTYDGEPVGKPTYQTNNSDGAVSVSYFEKGDKTPLAAAPTDAGSYTVTVSIGEGTTVAAGSASADFVISKSTFVCTVPQNLCIVAGAKLESVSLAAYGLRWVNPQTAVQSAGSFPALPDADSKNYFVEAGEVSVPLAVVSRIVARPTLDKSFDDDGAKHTVTVDDIVGFDATAMEIAASSVLSATQVGTYAVRIILTDADACWDDNTKGELVLTWNIGSFSVECSAGTADCYTVTTENGQTVVTFGAISDSKTVYQMRGVLDGCIVIDVGNDYKFELELAGLTVNSSAAPAISILSGDKVTLTAKKGSDNFVCDLRDEVGEEDVSAAVYSKVDLSLGGKGSLTVTSQHNNGVHGKKDVTVKNLTLKMTCCDNALKGNDGITVESGELTLIATKGDAVKTSDSDVSSKGKQRGNVTVLDGTLNLFAASDGIDAAHNVAISGGVVNICTDRYSPYSEEVVGVSGGMYYIRTTSGGIGFSVKYYNSEEDFVWQTATYYTSMKSGGNRPGSGATYRYYKVEKPANYSKMEVYVYSATQQTGQDKEYLAKFDDITVNNSYDMMTVLGVSGGYKLDWSNFTSVSNPAPGGPGFPGGPGMNEGNPDKSDLSTKGIKSDNEIVISGGTVVVKSYDDSIHANGDVLLGDPDDPSDDHYGTGNITVSGGSLTLLTHDDGIHADGTLTILGGVVKISDSYEGLEGQVVRIEGGDISVVSKDDGINGTKTTGESIVIAGGTLYVFAGGDGVDSNSKSSRDGILFAGGKSVIISTGNADSALDTERGYKHTGGTVVAICRSGGMSGESTNGDSSELQSKTLSASNFVVVADVVTVKMPMQFSALVVVLGNKNAAITAAASSSDSLDANGVCWKI